VIYRFGAFELDEQAGELRRGGELVLVQPKPLALLALLLRERERVVSQDELFEALWPGVAVTSGSLTRAVSHARRAIGDTHKGALIRSVPRRGYRFAGEVSVHGKANPAREPAPLAAPASTPTRPRPPSEIFVGREDALAKLRAAAEEARMGSGRLVLVTGSAGIGKTRLTEVFARELNEQGALVVVGRCRDGEGVPAFWLWFQVLRALEAAGHAAGTLPEAGTAPASPAEWSAERRFLFFDSLSRALLAASRARPLVLLLEDVQWAQAPSLRLLEHLTFEIAESRLLVVATVRSEVRERGHPVSRTLAVLRSHERCTQIDLAGLSRGAVGALLARVIGRPAPADLTSELFARTEGVPLFVREAVRLLVERGDLRHPERIRRRGVTLPVHSLALIRRSLDTLSGPCAELVGAGSVLGREFGLIQVAHVAQLERAEALDRIEEAVAAGVLEEVADAAATYRFTHALFQEAAYEDLSIGTKARLHLRAAERLEQQYGEDPSAVIAELAHHHHQAIGVGDPRRAFERAVQAAEVASRVFAYEQAATHYQQAAAALEHFESVDPGLRLSTCLALGEAYRRSGDRAGRRAVCEQAMQSARALGWSRELALAAIGFCDVAEWSPDDEAADAAVDEALAGLDPAEIALRARLMTRRAYLNMKLPSEKVEPVARKAANLSRESGDAEAIQEALYVLHYALAGPDHLDERQQLISEICDVARRSSSREPAVIASLDIACDRICLGDPAGERKLRAEASAMSGASPSPGMVWHMKVFDAGRALLEGRFDAADQLTRDALLVGQRIEHPYARACFNAQCMQRERDRGDFEQVRSLFAGGLRSRRGATHWAKAIVARNELQLGNEGLARELFADLVRPGLGEMARGIRWIGTMVETAHLCAELDDAEQAEVLVRLLAPVEHLHGVLPVPIQYGGPVSYCLARLYETLGRAEEARQLYEEARESVVRLGARPMQARIAQDAARLLARRRDLGRAEALLAEARDIADSLGMSLWDR
jgi:DNA-binding winged helix-turn-helix (wHTH) protein